MVVEVEYIEGIIGKNLLLLKETDAAMITDVLLGGEGVAEEPVVLGELHMSAINEIMNQMIGSSATSLSQLLGVTVNISAPTSYRMMLKNDLTELDNDDLMIVITFDMEIESLLNSQLVQLMPYDLGRAMSAMLTTSNAPVPPPPPPPPRHQPSPAPQYQAGPSFCPPQPQPPACAGFARPAPPVPGDLVDVRPLHFQSFDEHETPQINESGGIDSICNIPLTVAAELGTASKNLSEVLEFQPGVVFMLEKPAGDPVEVLVNGKRIARGEVVIIDDNYGVRITELPENKSPH